MNQTTISINDYQLKIYRAPKKSGYGIFTDLNLKKEDVNFVNYSGYVKDIQYLKGLRNMNPNGFVNLWQEMVLFGDTETGDLGILINSDSQSDGNISFDLENMKIFNKSGHELAIGWNKCILMEDYRIIIPIKAKRDIKRGEELIFSN